MMKRQDENQIRLPAEFDRFLQEDADAAALNCSAARRQLMFYMEDNVGNTDIVIQLAAFAGAVLTAAKNDTKIDVAVETVTDPELKSYMKKIRDNFKKM